MVNGSALAPRPCPGRSHPTTRTCPVSFCATPLHSVAAEVPRDGPSRSSGAAVGSAEVDGGETRNAHEASLTKRRARLNVESINRSVAPV